MIFVAFEATMKEGQARCDAGFFAGYRIRVAGVLRDYGS